MANLIKDNSPNAVKSFMDAVQVARYGGVMDGFGNIQKADTDAHVRAIEDVRLSVRAYLSNGAKESRDRANQEADAVRNIRAFMTKSDLPEVITSNFSTFMRVENYDMKWQASFDPQPIEPTRNFWEIVDITNGLQFEDVPEGGKLQIRELTGTKLIAFVRKYGGGIGWTDEMIRFRNVAAMLNTAKAFQDKFWLDKANRHYKLLSTAYGNSSSGNVTTYDSAAGSTVVDKDINTINSAVVTTITRLKDKGYGDVTSMPVVLYYPPALAARLIRALAYVGQDGVPNSPTRVNWQVQLLQTFNKYSNQASDTGTQNAAWGLMVFPGQKIQTATVMDPTAFYDDDIQSLTYIQTIWSYYGGAVGDTDQIQLVKFA